MSLKATTSSVSMTTSAGMSPAAIEQNNASYLWWYFVYMMSDQHHNRIEHWVDLSAKAEDVWAIIGDFGAIADWHPAIETCEVVEIAGDTHRHLTLGDGAKVLEKLTETGPNFYRYSIVESPLPLENYLATLTCSDLSEGGCRVFWSSIFDPLDPMADDIVRGVYDAGLEALRKRVDGA